MLSLEEDLEKINELENTIIKNDNNFKYILNKYECDINNFKERITNIEFYLKLTLILIFITHNYEDIITECIFTSISVFLAYKLY